MTNYVPINNTISRDIVRCLVSIGHALCNFGACCVITRSLLKHTDLNRTEFL